jgi:hypothetical protein
MTISTILTDPKQLLNPFGTSPCKINDTILDVVVSEGVEFSWSTSEYKLQSGGTSADVRIKDRIRLNLDCVFVDKTYGIGDLISAGLTGEGFAPETWRDKYRALKELADAEDIVTVTIGLDVFSSMVIRNVGIIRDEQRAGYLSFSLALEEIQTVDTDFEEVDTSLMPKDEDPEKTKKDEKKKKKLTKKKSETKKADEPERASTLYGMAY